MSRIILGSFIACLVAFCGCSSAPKYVEATQMALGAYVPIDGQLMGIEVVNYLNGCVVRACTNQGFTVERTYCATNDWCWGLLRSVETSKTKADVK